MIENRPPINFLHHVFSEDVGCVAQILVADGEDNYEAIIRSLTSVKETIEKWIGELNDESRHRRLVQGIVVEEKK